MKNHIKARFIIYIGIFFTLISPYLLTLNSNFFDFTNSGSIGDTIGGITSPIVGLIGAILVYFALQAQIEANAIIQKQLDEQHLTDSNKKIVNYLN